MTSLGQIEKTAKVIIKWQSSEGPRGKCSVNYKNMRVERWDMKQITGESGKRGCLLLHAGELGVSTMGSCPIIV